MIFVFKTSVQDETDIQQLSPYLNEIRPCVKWNFDLDDCDKILRVDSPCNNAKRIILLLQHKGYICEELLY